MGDALPFRESSIATSGLSTTMMLDSNALSMSPSLGSQFDDQGFTSSSSEIDWSMLQESNGQENLPSDLWFDGISSSFPQVGQQNMNPAFNPSSFLPDPSPNNGAQELYLPNAHSSSGSLFLSDITSIGGINLPPSAPPTGTVVPHVMPLLISIPTQEYHLHPPSTSIQLPANLSLGLLDGKGDEAVTNERRDGQSQRDSGKKGSRKRKADDALVGTKDRGAPKPKNHAKHTGETAGQEATDAAGTMSTTEADMPDLEKEAKITGEAAIEAAKAEKATVKAAKEAREVARPERARRSGRVSTLPDRLKEAGYAPPKRVSRGKKST